MEETRAEKPKRMRTAAQTAVMMAILTLVSKLFGFVREMVMAGAYGTNYIADAYVMAVAIPSMIFMGFYSALDTAYMPLYSELREKRGAEAGNRFTSETIVLAVMIAMVASAVGILFAQPITSIFASGFSGEQAELTTWFLRVTFCYGIFTSAAGLLEYYLRYRGVFLSPIIVGYVQNIILIGMIIVSAATDYHLLIFGWFFAYAMRLLIIWIISKKHSFQFYFNCHLGGTAKKIMALSLPVFIGSYVNQLNVFVDKTLASGLGEGCVAALNYGNLLVNLFSGLTISIIMAIIYPKMTQAQALGKQNRFNELVSGAMNLICMIAIPCTLGVVAYSQEIVQVIYERGAFGAGSTALTGIAVFYYSMGILFVSLNALFTQVFYSLHDMKTPVKYGMIGAGVNIACNLLFVRFMGHGGLALATSIAALCNAWMLAHGLKKRYSGVKIVESSGKLVKILASAFIAVACSKICYELILGAIWMPRMISLGIAVVVAAVVYLLLLMAFKIEELQLLKQLVGR